VTPRVLVVEDDFLVVRRLSDAAGADLSAVFGDEDDIHRAELAEFSEHSSRFIAQSRFHAQLAQEFPQHIRQEADQDVGLHAIGALMPDRSHVQLILVDAEGGFGLGELDVCLP